MKEYFIKGYAKRYSINENGDVISHYRFSGKGSKRYKVYKTTHLAKHFNTKSNTFKSVNLRPNKRNARAKTHSISSLMIEYFKLLPPDNFHYYDLIHIDGDSDNDELSNLEWEIRINEKYPVNFKPIAYHDNKRNVISKKCCHCGDVKTIDKFRLNKNYKKNKQCNPTFRNKCAKCTDIERWEFVKSDPDRYKRYLENGLRFSRSDRGLETAAKWREDNKDSIKIKSHNAYIKNYDKRRSNAKEYIKSLPNKYVEQIIRQRGENPDSYTDEMKEVVRLQIQIHRELRT